MPQTKLFLRSSLLTLLLLGSLHAEDAVPNKDAEKPFFDLPDVLILGIDQKDNNDLEKEVLVPKDQEPSIAASKEDIDYHKDPLGPPVWPLLQFKRGQDNYYRMITAITAGSYDSASLSSTLHWPIQDWLLTGGFDYAFRGNHIPAGSANRNQILVSGEELNGQSHYALNYDNLQFGQPWNAGSGFIRNLNLSGSKQWNGLKWNGQITQAQDPGTQSLAMALDPQGDLQFQDTPVHIGGWINASLGNWTHLGFDTSWLAQNTESFKLEAHVQYDQFQGLNEKHLRVLPRLGAIWPQANQDQWEAWVGQSVARSDAEKWLLTLPYVELNRQQAPELAELELSGRYHLAHWNGMQGTVTLFYRNSSNTLAYVDTDADTLVEPTNIGNRSQVGLETTLSKIMNPQLSIVSKLHAALHDAPIPLEAPFTLGCDIRYQASEQTEWVMENRYYSSRFGNMSGGLLSDVLLISLHITSALKDNVSGYLDITNLLGSPYQWIMSAPEPGFAISLGMKIQLNPY